ncbi:MAG: hydantoinase/oxoprolinase family protein [Candidatus Tectomicrobia bacterium]|uniref:Hydantoinase/oxoprolinase family protein n=1 Tax=Tectimicrobiota bacterium TaxID=2528274 RepID=A0A933LR69_UNCTE|nr:hydantoinase/oxoprolinase family protein [Candidatus Tectomicrobia bacterium]
MKNQNILGKGLRIGIDTGGTFTDFILIDQGKIRIYKLSSDPNLPGRPILDGLKHLIELKQIPEIVCGSTVATNVLLERKGAKTALITTQGFEDILEIGRQNRPKIYDLQVEKPPPLVPRALRYGIRERISAQGKIVETLQIEQVNRLVKEIKNERVEAVAVCLLFSYANPIHELEIARLSQGKGLGLSLSHQILPEFREYERCSTTVINAYVSTQIDLYLSYLENHIQTGQFRIMQSNGGCISTSTARREAVRTIFSGPAAGVLGGFELSKLAGYSQVITFDMGGTSTDVALCNDRIEYTTEAMIGGFPVKVPMISIHSVGAGGGSLAYTDSGGALRVGPKSAGAEPGPACYGKSKEGLTVTDANLFLGRLDPEHFLGGEKKLYPERILTPLKKLAQGLDLSMEATASGVINVVNANMERAIRVISIEKGYDPGEFSLIAFGGAGPMHACELARNLLIPRVIVPAHPGALSALGLLLADVVKDYSQTILLRTDVMEKAQLADLFGSMEVKAREDMGKEGFESDFISSQRYLDMRYVGQSFELIIPWDDDFIGKFHRMHEQFYGYSLPNKSMEIVNLRLKVIGKTEKPTLPYESGQKRKAPHSARAKTTRCYWDGHWESVPVFQRERLKPGHHFTGPAIVVEYSATTVIPGDFAARVDGYLNLILEKISCE